MNLFALLILIVLLTSNTLSKGIKHECCSFPSRSSFANTNITNTNFQCKEPISFSCLNPTVNFINVGIAGFPNGSESYDIITKSPWSVEQAVVCNPTTRYWHPSGNKHEYEFFSCAFQKYDEEWVIVN